MKEDEIDSLIDRIEDKTNFVKTLVREFHFSEEFILKYIDILSENDILKNHRREVKSGEYARISLLYETKKF